MILSDVFFYSTKCNPNAHLLSWFCSLITRWQCSSIIVTMPLLFLQHDFVVIYLLCLHIWRDVCISELVVVMLEILTRYSHL